MDREQNSAGFRSRALLAATVFALLVVAFSFYLSRHISQSREQIIQEYTLISEQAAGEFAREVSGLLETVWYAYLADHSDLSRRDETKADSLLSAISDRILSRYEGTEGGIYFRKLDKFIGYAYPSIPSPKPAYGPPPRSYHIIRDQLRQSISENRSITALHGFDPAVFPLATRPVLIDGVPEAGIWTRVHISRDLAAAGDVTSALITVTLVVGVMGFLVAIFLSWRMTRNLAEIRDGLARIKSDNTYRMPGRRGLPGFISHYINDMMDELTAEQQRNQKLQHDLHQKEKMASLGSTIAGVAHEINTPVSIIKTRIQMWERNRRRAAEQSGHGTATATANANTTDTGTANATVNANTTGTATATAIATANDTDPTDEAHSLLQVHQQIDRISLLVKRLLSFSRPVAQRRYPVPIREVLSSAVHITREKYPDRAMSIALPPESEAVPRISGDFVTLEQVFCNVLDNAVKLAVGDPEIAIGCSREGGRIRVTIADNGPGIPVGLRDKIFEPFFTTREEGSGLGLAITKEIVRAHGGEIGFGPRPDAAGSVCTLYLPVLENGKTDDPHVTQAGPPPSTHLKTDL